MNVEIDDQVYDVLFEYYPGDPGNCFGPPEVCEPPTAGSVEIYQVFLPDGTDVIDFIDDSVLERIENILLTTAGE